jgi:hypothetical protein
MIGRERGAAAIQTVQLESCVGPDGVRQYWLPDDAADTGIGSAGVQASR